MSENTQTHSHWYAEAFIHFKTASRCERGGPRINTSICSPVWGTSWPSVSRKLKRKINKTTVRFLGYIFHLSVLFFKQS